MNTTTTTTTNQSFDVNLVFKNGRSDKQYRVYLKHLGQGEFAVMASYGRVGGAQITNQKYRGDQLEAMNTCDRLVREKMSKGYKLADTNAAPPVATVKPTAVTFIPPMLLTPIDSYAADTFENNGRWCAQPKFDGIRAQLHKFGGECFLFSRTGNARDIPAAVLESAQRIAGDTILDGELVGDIFYAFDLLYLGGVESLESLPMTGDMRGLELQDRLEILEVMIDDDGPLQCSPWAFGTEAKKQMRKDLYRLGAEGIVYKNLKARYSSGRGADACKLKYVASASVIVDSHNAKRSINIRLNDGTALGSVTIPPNRTVPVVGQIIEVKYLYAMPGGSLIQAVYLQTRDDVYVMDCNQQQLQFKAAERKAS